MQIFGKVSVGTDPESKLKLAGLGFGSKSNYERCATQNLAHQFKCTCYTFISHISAQNNEEKNYFVFKKTDKITTKV